MAQTCSCWTLDRELVPSLSSKHLSSALQAQVSKLSSRLKEREEQLSEAQDCYSKLDAIYQAEKADVAHALSSKVGTFCPCTHAWHLRSTDIPLDMSALPPSAAKCRITVPATSHDCAHSPNLALLGMHICLEE